MYTFHIGHTSCNSRVAGEDAGVDEPLALQLLPEGNIPASMVD